jgi:peptidoglycan/LPS O-acetylase OafA/YrhL
MTIVYATLIIAHAKWLKRFNHQIDPSYGIYLYAWPVQQLLAYYFILTAYESMLLSVPIVTMLGFVSYIYIERPAIKSVPVFYRYLHK